MFSLVATWASVRLRGESASLPQAIGVQGKSAIDHGPNKLLHELSDAANRQNVNNIRSLQFEDREDGAVVVADFNTNEHIAVLMSGEGAFVRGTLRMLTRERRRHGFGIEQPFKLLATKNGALLLIDPATNTQLVLDAFGVTNAAAFSRFLSVPGATDTELLSPEVTASTVDNRKIERRQAVESKGDLSTGIAVTTGLIAWNSTKNTARDLDHE